MHKIRKQQLQPQLRPQYMIPQELIPQLQEQPRKTKTKLNKKKPFDIFDELQRAANRKGLNDNIIDLDSVVERKPYTMVTVTYENRIGVGFAKCGPNDVYDTKIGQTIALFRAVEDLKN